MAVCTVVELGATRGKQTEYQTTQVYRQPGKSSNGTIKLVASMSVPAVICWRYDARTTRQ